MSSASRRLSPWRVILAILILTGVVISSGLGVRHWVEDRKGGTSNKSWFASYVDVTATPTFAFEQMGKTDKRDAVLSFIVSYSADPCTPSWGGVYTLDQARASLDLDRRIARLQQQDGSIAVSFGGRDHSELAVECTDAHKLLNAYKSVVDRYNIDTIDLDLENSALSNPDIGERRAKAIAQLQAQSRKSHKNLAVWATLAVTPDGLSEDGTSAVGQLLKEGVDLAGVNIMTMDFGSSRAKGQSMLSASENALVQAHRQISILYQNSGTHLNDSTVWSKIGVTPMIGQNDNANEVFSLDDAKGLNKFARSHKVKRISMWSGNRDIACGSNYVNLKVVSTSCSGVEQSQGEFASTLGAGIDGNISLSSGLVTNADPTKGQEPDNPDTSPYQIWSAEGAYLEGTKVVWHHNVYQAKWWTQGDVPDSPVLQTWQTPWKLIGPVLAGEKPIPQPKLPDGTYPDWSGSASYDTGQRVLFKGVPYQSKWWNKGNSPAAASSNADSSPWVPLTQEQVNKVVRKK
ncbi:MAG TPA: carbohydrate-binding protein [Candidatus Saccharimonadales bacterium]|nr:carbohydrate-binding protein [Candidatus Saccharimonadales bacterium]